MGGTTGRSVTPAQEKGTAGASSSFTASAHLDGPRDAEQAGGYPGFPLDLGPVAVLGVHPVLTALLHHLHEAQPGHGHCWVPSSPHTPAQPSTYHETSVVDVPGECGHGSVLGVHDRVLQDVDGVGDIGWEEALCPARHPVGLGQEPPREQLVVRRHLPVHDVFGQDMFAKMRKETSRPALRQLSPGLAIVRD